jgi:hypothetical protein
MTMTRIAYVTTANTGAQATVTAPEGVVVFERFDPHGVVLSVAGNVYSISKDALPYLGRFFLAAALELGVDINASWNGPQMGGEPR